MPTLAVEVTAIGDGPYPKRFQGILPAKPVLGRDCIVYLGGDQYFSIACVKGWIGPTDGDYLILFDDRNARFRVEVIATSQDFLS